MAAACSVGPEAEITPDEGFYEFTLKASAADDAGTRTTYAGDKTFAWSDGDQISVLFHKGGDNKFFALTTKSVNGATATFSGLVANGYEPGASDTGTRWALYPAAEHSYTADFPTFNMPGTIDYSASHFYALVPMYARGEGSSFTFTRLSGTYKFSFTGLGANRVRFEVENQNTHQLSGNIPVKQSGSTVYLSHQYSSPGSATSKLSFTENTENGAAAFYVPFRAYNSSFKPIISLYDADTDALLYTKTAKKDFTGYEASLSRIIIIPSVDLGELPPSEAANVSYTESDAVIINPERGFYKAFEYKSASATPLSASKVQSARTAGRSLLLLEYYLTDFIESDISSAYLTLIEKNFQTLRSGGAKCILRFAYKNNHNDNDKPWDATEAWVMRHIEQLKPLLQSYGDVIFVLQAGFIGSWGEWYYTDNFGFKPSTDAEYAPRGRVLDALLDAMPEDRQVEVRTPTFKMKLVGSTPLTEATAHNGSKAARVGGHNDCFGASSSDSGTYHSDSERSFWAADSRYTIMGGETCALSDWCHCEAYNGAPGTLSELKKYHWTYLHDGYHQDVLARWKTEDCFDRIDRELGYRLVLEDASFGAAVAGGTMDVTVHLRNKGYAAPMNPRGVYLVLQDASTGNVLQTTAVTDTDLRFWGPEDGQITISKTLTMPGNFQGPMNLCLFLPDSSPNLREDPRFAIRFANENVWDGNSGFNLLYSFRL